MPNQWTPVILYSMHASAASCPQKKFDVPLEALRVVPLPRSGAQALVRMQIPAMASTDMLANRSLEPPAHAAFVIPTCDSGRDEQAQPSTRLCRKLS